MSYIVVFFLHGAVNQNVVEVNRDLTRSDLISENSIHERLESSGGVSEPEKHYLRLK
jgi:hypothetical protein